MKLEYFIGLSLHFFRLKGKTHQRERKREDFQVHYIMIGKCHIHRKMQGNKVQMAIEKWI